MGRLRQAALSSSFTQSRFTQKFCLSVFIYTYMQIYAKVFTKLARCLEAGGDKQTTYFIIYFLGNIYTICRLIASPRHGSPIKKTHGAQRYEVVTKSSQRRCKLQNGTGSAPRGGARKAGLWPVRLDCATKKVITKKRYREQIGERSNVHSHRSNGEEHRSHGEGR